ncbi:histidine kinase [Gammaproteobacteria bacterium]
MRFNRGLRFRVTWAFALFGGILSLLLTTWLYYAAHDVGVRLMGETLRAELEDYLARRHRNPLSLPPATVTVLGYVTPSPEGAPALPEKLREIPPGRHRVTLDRVPYQLLVQDVEDSRYYLLFNETRQASREGSFFWLLGLGVLAMTLLASIGGLWLAGRVVAPLQALAERVQTLEPEAVESPLEKDFPADELGALAHAFDRYLARLRAFIERERAFTTDVSHELRTPLAIIQGAAEIQNEDESLTPHQRQRALRIQRATQDMAEITTALLVLARERHPTAPTAPCPVAEVIQDAVEKHRYLIAGRPLEVVTEMIAEPRLAAERALLFIVIGNLIRNAFQHAGQGEVRIILEAGQLTVKDSGRGVAEADLAHLFERHYRGADSRGEGIGLSLTKRICDHYGWQLQISNNLGGGVTILLGFGAQAAT